MRRPNHVLACPLLLAALSLGGCRTLIQDAELLVAASFSGEMIPYGATFLSLSGGGVFGFGSYRPHWLLYLPFGLALDTVFLPYKIPAFIYESVRDEGSGGMLPPEPDWAFETEDQGGTKAFEFTHGKKTTQVLLRPRAQPEGGQRWTVVEVQPEPEGAVSVRLLQIAFGLIGVEDDIETREGRLVEHPDRRLKADLLKALTESPARVAQVVRRLPELFLRESRLEVFCQAAAGEGLEPSDLDALVEAIESHERLVALPHLPRLRDPWTAPRISVRGTPAWSEDPGSAKFLEAAMRPLAQRKDLGQARANRLARAMRWVSPDAALLLLEQDVSTSALLEGIAPDNSQPLRREQVERLATLAGVRNESADVAAVLEVCFRRNRPPPGRVLWALVRAGAELRAVVEAAPPDPLGDVGGPRGRTLLAMAQEEGLSASEAETLARVAAELNPNATSVSYVLKTLSHKGADLDMILEVNRGFGGRYKDNVLSTLAKNPRLTQAQAEEVAEQAVRLGYAPAWIFQYLIQGPASTQALVAALRRVKLQKPGQLGELAADLAKRPLSVADGEALAALCAELPDDAGAPVLVSLAGGPTPTAALLATVSSGRLGAPGRRDVLQALLRRPQLSQAQANHVAALVPGLQDEGYMLQVTLGLVGKASREAVESILPHLTSGQQALVRRQLELAKQ